MAELILKIDLKQKLDEIDSEVIAIATEYLQEGRYTVLIGMWQKGEAIGGSIGIEPQRRGIFTELERKTGRNHSDLKKWHDLYKEYSDFEAYKKVALEKAKLWSQRHLESKQEAIATKWTRDPESYTPEQYIESVRQVMGSIDVDPASNDFANQKIKATVYYTSENSGLEKPWTGNVFLNPPYKQPEVRLFVEKLIQEIQAQRTNQAILLTNNNTDTRWFAEAALVSAAICFTQGRINFYKADESITQPTNGQAFFYFGYKADVFAEEFSKYGLIYTLYSKYGDSRRSKNLS